MIDNVKVNLSQNVIEKREREVKKIILTFNVNFFVFFLPFVELLGMEIIGI